MEDGGPAQVMPGRKAGSVIVYCGDGFHYNIREVRSKRVRLLCRHYKSRGGGCPGTATVNLATGYLTHLEPHNHDRDRLLRSELYARRAMVDTARSSTFGKKIHAILRDAKIRCVICPSSMVSPRIGMLILSMIHCFLQTCFSE